MASWLSSSAAFVGHSATNEEKDLRPNHHIWRHFLSVLPLVCFVALRVTNTRLGGVRPTDNTLDGCKCDLAAAVPGACPAPVGFVRVLWPLSPARPRTAMPMPRSVRLVGSGVVGGFDLSFSDADCSSGTPSPGYSSLKSPNSRVCAPASLRTSSPQISRGQSAEVPGGSVGKVIGVAKPRSSKHNCIDVIRHRAPAREPDLANILLFSFEGLRFRNNLSNNHAIKLNFH